jgi:RNA polymerase sigma factor (TIGR02999 family)
MSDSDTVTRLLDEISGGRREASDELLPVVYGELRRLAHARMARLKPNQTLQPTELVHEAYLRLVQGGDPGWDSRGHFFAAAAEAMRRIIVDRARRAASLKRGGDRVRITLSAVRGGVEPRPEELVAIDVALDRLQAQDPRMTEVVKLRFFAGLTQDETALAMGISRRTVNRLSMAARAWLTRELDQR